MTDSGVQFDADGYMFDYMSRPEPLASEVVDLVPDSADEIQRILLVYFLLRSSVLVFQRTSEGDLVVVAELSRRLLLVSLKHAPAMIADPPLPFAIGNEDRRIKEVFGNDYPAIRGVRLASSLDTHFFAWTDPHARVITISALTREYLMKCNLAIWNWVFSVSDEVEATGSVRSLNPGSIAGLFASLALPGYRDLDHGHVGYPRAYDGRALAAAVQSTGYQMTYLLGHEYGHVALHDGLDVQSTPTLAFEQEADQFALSVTMSRDDSDHSRVFVAIVWLSQILGIAKLVGGLINDFDGIGSEVRAFSARARAPEIWALHQDGRVDEVDYLSATLGSRLLRDVAEILIADSKGGGPLLAECASRMQLPTRTEFIGRLVDAHVAVHGFPGNDNGRPYDVRGFLKWMREQ